MGWKIDIFGQSLIFGEHIFFKNTVGWVCELSESPGYQWASSYQEYNTISKSHQYLGDEALLCYFEEMQVIRAFSLHKRCYRSIPVNPWIHLPFDLHI